MGIRFAPHDGTLVLLRTLSPEEPMPHELRCPSGWWILPAIVVGCFEWIAIIGWIVS